jgi:endonuclease/exonuclease/phosphatase family metal-dependent hydrolase
MNRFVLLAAFLTTLAGRAQSLRVMTYNIRFATASDGDNQWLNRRDHLASQLQFHEPALVGMQEALKTQIDDIQQRLPTYRWVGKGRDDGRDAGEFSPIFYDPRQVDLLENQTFWLSTTPDVPSKGWDASLPRVVTWAKFRLRRTGRVFYHFNTHYDHRGPEARRESSRLLLQKIRDIAGKVPVVVTGDFNATVEDEPIRVLLDGSSADRLTLAKTASATPAYGPEGTFNGFKEKESGLAIDHIFIKNGVTVQKFAVFSQTWEGLFASDHHPVYAELTLPR